MFGVLAVFPVEQAVYREDGLTDFVGAVWDYMTVDTFPGPNVVKLAVLLHRDDQPDSMPRHVLKVFADDPKTGANPVLSQPVPGLASGQHNGVAVLDLPFEIPGPGLLRIWIQIDDGPAVWTMFDVRLRGDDS